MKIEMRDLQKALDVLRSIEDYDPATSAPGTLGTMRAKAFCARCAIETSLSFEQLEVAA